MVPMLQDSETYFLSSFPEGTFLVETMQSYFGVFSVHGFTGCIPPCKFRLKLLCLSGQQTKSNGIETSFLIGDIWWFGMRLHSGRKQVSITHGFLVYFFQSYFWFSFLAAPATPLTLKKNKAQKNSKIPLSKSKIIIVSWLSNDLPWYNCLILIFIIISCSPIQSFVAPISWRRFNHPATRFTIIYPTIGRLNPSKALPAVQGSESANPAWRGHPFVPMAGAFTQTTPAMVQNMAV